MYLSTQVYVPYSVFAVDKYTTYVFIHVICHVKANNRIILKTREDK